MKTYIAFGCWVGQMKREHIGGNGSHQATVLIRAASKKRVAALTRSSLYQLNRMGLKVATQPAHLDIVKKDEMIYYNIGYGPIWDRWFEVKP